MSKTLPEAPTPAEGGAYVVDPKTGERRRDGHTEQTRETDPLLPRDPVTAGKESGQ